MQFLHYDEGLCVQCMHVGSYDAEPETLEQMDAFAREQGYETDFTGTAVTTKFTSAIHAGRPRKN